MTHDLVKKQRIISKKIPSDVKTTGGQERSPKAHLKLPSKRMDQLHSLNKLNAIRQIAYVIHNGQIQKAISYDSHLKHH